MDFDIIGELSDVETIAVNLSIREHADLKARFGGSRWRASRPSDCPMVTSVGRRSIGRRRMASVSAR
jgi:hypothetical protein